MFLREINLFEFESDLTSSINHIRTSKTLKTQINRWKSKQMDWIRAWTSTNFIEML